MSTDDATIVQRDEGQGGPAGFPSVRQALVLSVLGWALLTAFLFGAPNDIDRYDQAKQGLYVVDAYYNGHFLLPRDLGHYPTKPPLYTWLCWGAAGITGGVDSYNIRYPAAVAALGVLLLTFWIAVRMGGPTLALASAWCLIANQHYARLATMARTDMLLCFFMLAALACFLRGRDAGGLSEDDAEPVRRALRRRSRWYLLMWVAMGFATLTKGPVGLLAPLIGIVGFLGWQRKWREVRTLKWWPGLLIAAAIPLAWFVPALLSGGSGYAQVTLVEELLDRLKGGGNKEFGAPWFYVPKLLYLMLPWSVIMIGAFVDEWRRERSRALIAWAVLVFVFFSLIPAGKRKDYIFPVVPALCMLMSVAVLRRGRWTRPAVLGTGIAAAVIGCVCVVIGAVPVSVVGVLEELQSLARKVQYRHLRGLEDAFVACRWYLMGAGVSSLAGAWLCVRGVPRERARSMMVGAVLAGLAFVVLSRTAFSPSGFYGTIEERGRFCQRVLDERPPGVELVCCSGLMRSVFFLLRWNEKPVVPDALPAFLAGCDKPAMVVLRDDALDELPASTRAKLVELFRTEPFGSERKRHSLVALRWPGQGAAKPDKPSPATAR